MFFSGLGFGLYHWHGGWFLDTMLIVLFLAGGLLAVYEYEHKY
jgi:hypothetical protein